LQYWLNKRFKAKEKATKAAMARWGKYKAKIEAKNDAPSIAQAVHMQCPIPIEVQEQKQIPTPPPPAAQEGQDAASSTLRRIEKPRQTPRQAGTAPRQTGRSPRHLGIAPRQAGTAKKTNGKLGPTARRNEVSEGIHPKNTSDAVAVPPNLIAPGAANGVRPMKTTLAPAGFKDEVFRYWEEQNPAGPPCPWDEHEDRALEALLRSSPGITFAMFKQMLSNRAASGIAASILPRKWLRGLMEYLSGSLDRFKHPVAAGRVM
jgi:hypothetical protein